MWKGRGPVEGRLCTGFRKNLENVSKWGRKVYRALVPDAKASILVLIFSVRFGIMMVQGMYSPRSRVYLRDRSHFLSKNSRKK